MYMVYSPYTKQLFDGGQMTLNARFRVPMPESGVIVRRGGAGGRDTVYKVLETFRNAKGQPTNTRKAIGRLDHESGMLIPNNAYYELYDSAGFVEVLPAYNSVKNIGATFLLSHIFSTLGVSSLLEDIFGERRSSALLTGAMYMACRGNVFEQVLDWCDNSLLYEKPLSSQSASELFASISFDERMAFFRSWVERHKGKEGYLVYDVTSFSTYSKGISDAEWGYNRDGDKLAQINLGCYLLEDIGLPMFYVTYPGSIVDKSHMRYMMAYNDDLDIKDAGFVMDRGFCSPDNARWLHSTRSRYVMATEMRYKMVQNAVEKVRSGITSYRHRVADEVYGRPVRSSFYGVPTTMHVYYSAELAIQHRRDMIRTMEIQEERLKQIKTLSKNQAKYYERFFNISRKEDGTFTFFCDESKVDEASKYSGFFCLLSNMALTSAQILSIYKRRDVLEKNFDDVKNHIDMKRLRTHGDATTDGKLFCAFIALIAVSELTHKLKDFKEKKSMSKDSIISELEKIKSISAAGNRRMMNPLTKKQREIFEAFGLNQNKLHSYVSANQ